MDVTVYGPLRGATGAKTVTLQCDPDTVAEVVDAFVQAYPRARPQLFTEDGALRPSVRVTVDGGRASFDDSCPAGATVSLFPAIQTGRRRIPRATAPGEEGDNQQYKNH
ncbi:MoaD/ThiS family protein [Natronosalvus rutilus]|uniref:MoaD/ThiS family protein n=1 Tax=Natronosalvus rutilus TaxID=2953753 RepID=A0A9E7NBA1_9EURY|nr:MoaD/ThiS family protein [Natronosalvus rutilus]UTF54735.1 MoaD/ThiS family protein [Natronosalvus rutilus]